MKRFVFSFLFLATAFIAKAQTADEIIAKHIEAIGGADKWKKVNSLKLEGTLIVQGTTVNMTQTILHQKGNRQDISVMGMNGFMIIAPTSGWNFMPFNGQAAPEPMTAEDVAENQSELDVQGILIDYAAKGHSVEYLGKDDVEGTDCFKLKINLKGGKSDTYFFDAKSYLLIRTISKQKSNGQEAEVTTNFSNYEKQPEGILVAKSIGLPFGELNITKVTINPAVDENIFKN
jgi:outer membrane lipoprotein-sorting protein